MRPTICLICLLLLSAAAAAQVQALQAWWTASGETDSTYMTQSIAPLGDINGDGLSDFANRVGTHEINVYLGNTQPDSIPDIILHSPNSSFGWFGYGLFSVGDVNGDGYPDFIAGASVTDYSTPRYAYLYFGGPNFDTIPDLSFVGPTSNMTHFAREGVGLGDINGDGYNDFAIFDDNYSVSGPPPVVGAIYIYYGGNPPDSIPDVIIHADSTLNRIGFCIAPLGDVNGDGYADFVMSDPDCQGQQGESGAGLVAIYYGGNPPDTIPHQIIHGPANSGLGRSLTTLDWNGNGQVDIFAGGAMQYPPNYYSSIWEFNISPTMTGQPDHVFLGEGGYLNCMGNVMFHADLNGDGRQDLIDGEPGWEICGKVYVFLGGTNTDTLYDAIYYQGNFNASLGHSGCNVGDVNGDGIEDIAIMEAYGNGRLHLILGDDTLHQSVGVVPFPQPAIPQTTALLKAYPNPFNGQVVMEISAPSLKGNQIQIYNLKGEEIRKFQLGIRQHRVVWDGKSSSGLTCASGIYLAKLTGLSYQTTTKLTLIR